MNIIYVILGAVVLVILWLVFSYNRLVVLRNRCKEAWSDISVQLKRRYDLIPNLVEAVKGYAGHERELFEKVTEARTRAMGAVAPKDKAVAENALSGTLKSLFAVVENYPQLQAAGNFLELQRELRDTEDKIQASRRFYNNNAMEINNKIEVFPSNIVASVFGFAKVEFFETSAPEEREPVKVKFQ
jgi:LemA protein